jgi:hypothetical protein
MAAGAQTRDYGEGVTEFQLGDSLFIIHTMYISHSWAEGENFSKEELSADEAFF